jgi:hypothetical protein
VRRWKLLIVPAFLLMGLLSFVMNPVSCFVWRDWLFEVQTEGMTLPEPRYLPHPPQHFAPSAAEDNGAEEQEARPNK